MFTQCPDCKKTYPLGADPVPGNNLLAYCSACEKEFNALEFLSESPAGEVQEIKSTTVAKADIEKKTKLKSKKKRKPIPQLAKTTSTPEFNLPLVLKPIPEIVVALQPAQEPETVLEHITEEIPESMQTGALPWENNSPSSLIDWRFGSIFGVLILITQLIYFEADDLSQNVAYRPYLEKICHVFGCHLIGYKNLDEFEVMQGSFATTGNNAVTFKAVINNQAAFEQTLPNIRLTLLDYEERIFAQRLFKPNEYLPGYSNKVTIASDESMEVQLNISAPKTPIGGYYFDLIF